MQKIIWAMTASALFAAVAACKPPSPATAGDTADAAAKDTPPPGAPIAAAPATPPPNRASAPLTAEELALFTTRLRCGDTLVEFAILDTGTADMRIANVMYAMRAVEAASGARFENPGNPETTFWNQGNQAMVTIDGKQLPECSVVQDADTDSVPAYKARGNEPGWHLTIGNGAVQLVADYGDTAIDAPISNEQRTGMVRTVIADADTGAVQIDISAGGCIDSMSGDQYADTVSVTLGERRFIGCGGAHWLRDITWRLLSMNGEQSIGSEALTVEFGDEGRVSGYAGCNRFNGSYTLEGERLAFNPTMAATKRGCMSDALMQQETQFLMALPGMTEVRTNGEGNLVLGDSAGARMVFRPAS